jgi:hypothetical protein
MNRYGLTPIIDVFYYPDDNIFKTKDGKAIINLYPLVSPNQIFLFKHKQETTEIVNYEHGIRIRLLYPTNKKGEIHQ